MQRIINRKSLLGKSGTAHNLNATLNSFLNFMNGNHIAVAKITQGLIEDYESWLRQKCISSNSVSFYLRNLRAMYNQAVEAGLSIDRHPFRKAYTRIEKTAKRAITLPEIKRIKDFDFSTSPYLDLSRDIFLFLFYCRGMSLIDAAFITHNNIRGDYLCYRRHKTGQNIRIGLNNYILNLISKWHKRCPDNPFILPIIYYPYSPNYYSPNYFQVDSHYHYSSNHGKPNFDRSLYESALRRTNKHLKQIARHARITANLTTYVSRHSWASIAKTKGIPIATISDGLGHDSQLTTQIYLSTLSTETIDRANNLILNDL